MRFLPPAVRNWPIDRLKRCAGVRRLLAASGLSAMIVGSGCLPNWSAAAEPDSLEVAELRRRTGATEDLGWLSTAAGPHPWIEAGQSRHDLVVRKHHLQD